MSVFIASLSVGSRGHSALWMKMNLVQVWSLPSVTDQFWLFPSMPLQTLPKYVEHICVSLSIIVCVLWKNVCSGPLSFKFLILRCMVFLFKRFVCFLFMCMIVLPARECFVSMPGA